MKCSYIERYLINVFGSFWGDLIRATRIKNFVGFVSCAHSLYVVYTKGTGKECNQWPLSQDDEPQLVNTTSEPAQRICMQQIRTSCS